MCNKTQEKAFLDYYSELPLKNVSYLYHCIKTVELNIRDHLSFWLDTYQHPYGFIMVGNFCGNLPVNRGVYKNAQKAFEAAGIDMTGDIDKNFLNHKSFKRSNVFVSEERIVATKQNTGDWSNDAAKEEAGKIIDLVRNEFHVINQRQILRKGTKEEEVPVFELIDLSQYSKIPLAAFANLLR